MKEQIILIMLLSVLWSCKSTKKAKTLPTPVSPTETIITEESDSLSFPESWVGHYKGQLNIFSTSPEPSTFDMELRIGQEDATGHHPWVPVSYTHLRAPRDRG